MKKLHRYYLKELTVSALISALVLFGIVLISSVYRALSRAEGFGLLDAAKITIFLAADTLQHLMPIALLFATVLTFARAARDREITAIRAAGVSPRVAMVPALILGLLTSLLAGQVFHQIAPEFHFQKFRVVADTIRNLVQTTGMLGDRFKAKGLVMTWDRKTEDNHWHDVIIQVGRDRPEFGPLDVGVFLADEAWVEVQGEDVLVLTLLRAREASGDGWLPEEVRIGISLRAIVDDQELRKEDEKDQTSDQLLSEVYRGVHERQVTARYTVNRRTAFALLPTLLAPIGFCIGVMARERGRVLALVFGLVPIAIFYLTDFVATQFVRRTSEPAFAFLPAIVLTLAGIPFCWRLLKL
jgi:lipopolysaccharide export LptBFGC system permease protein LptF